MSDVVDPLRHPLLRLVDGVGELLGSAGECDPIYLSTSEKQALLVAVRRQVSQLEALEAKTLAAADDVAEAHGARSAGVWLAHATRHDAPEGRRWQRTADGLSSRWPVLAAAYAGGEATTGQVRVVGAALDALPADLDPDLRVRAEEHLVGLCAEFSPRQLRVLGRRVLDVIAPEVAEAHEARLLEREEQAAWDAASITTRRLGNGSSQATVRLPDAVMDRWLTLLHAFTSPRREGHVPSDERVPYPTGLAHGFAALLERIPGDWLPTHGGTTTTVVVTIDADRLTAQLAAAGLSTGTPITASEARRLACTSGILPMVLDGASQPLDLGRSKRLYGSAQRKAMAVRDRHCRTEGCEVPAAWCEAHHLHPWNRGGKTDLADGALLCSFHHHRAHDARYDLRRLPSGDFRFCRRT